MFKKKILWVLPIITLFVGCGTAVDEVSDDKEISISDINEMQESLIKETQSIEDESLPKMVRTNKQSTQNNDEGYPDEN